jgi:nucleoid DNA-binding protein
MIKSELIQRIASRNEHLYHRDVETIVSTILVATGSSCVGLGLFR